MPYDLIIIGGGPAAMSAGIYAARKKLKTLIVTQNLGGQVLEGYIVDNYLGIPETPGIELVDKFTKHLKKFGKGVNNGNFDLKIKEGVTVHNVKKLEDNQGFEVHTGKENFLTKTVIITTGKSERKLDIPGAKEFEGKGISYCATCDAPLFRDKIVAVIGAGDAGQDTAWQLVSYASKIYLLNKYKELRGDNIELQERIKKEQKIEIIPEVLPKEILGDRFVNGLIYANKDTGEQNKIEINGIFVEIGSTPTSLFVNGLLKTNEKGEIVIDHATCATSVPGVFAAGDVTDTPHKQIVIAAGMGAIAALSAYDYLKNLN